MPENTVRLDETQACAIIHLLGKVAVMPGGLDAKKRATMEGLAKLIDADAWIWAVSTTDPETKAVQPLGLVMEGIDPRPVLASANRHGDLPPEESEPDIPRFMALLEPGVAVTRTRQQLLSDDEWYTNGHVQKVRLPSGVDHNVISLYLGKDGRTLSALGFHRRPGRPPFDPIECRILHIASSEIEWLHQATMPETTETERIQQLPPRLRKTLVLLLQGKTRNEIAAALNLTPNTIHSYTKDIYEALGVSSKAELLRHFIAGNGRDLDV